MARSPRTSLHVRLAAGALGASALVLSSLLVSAERPGLAPASNAGEVLAAGAQQPAAPAFLALPPARQDAEGLWATGGDLERRGRFGDAAQTYLSIAELQPQGDRAPQALMAAARAWLAEDRPDAAVEALNALLGGYSESAYLERALIVLARARREAGDCAGALEALQLYQQIPGPNVFGPYPALERSACLLQLQDYAGALAATNDALKIDGGGPRRAQLEAHERAGEALRELGRPAEAFDAYNRALELGTTRLYRGQMLYTTGQLALLLGRDDVAAERFRAIVVDMPEHSRAPGALEALEEMGRAGSLSPYQLGMVRFLRGDYAAARSLFEQVPADHPSWGDARFNAAVARLRLGEEDAAVEEMKALAETDTSWAPAALLRAGRVQESNDQFAQAEATYLRLLALRPDSERGAEALVRVGMTRYMRNNPAGALEAWQAAVAPERKATRTIAAQAHFWRGKVLDKQGPAQRGAAAEAWQAAVAVAPDTYYGLRAADLLAGQAVPRTQPAPRNPALLERDESESADLAQWLGAAGGGITPETLKALMAEDPNLARADLLRELGLVDEAAWEVEVAQSRFATAKDAVRLAGLADWLMARGDAATTLIVGRQLRDLLGGSVFGMPTSLRRSVYPAGWGDLAFESAARLGVDPFLVLGLVRQESSFVRTAVSSANARGLAQVVPSTGTEIARGLGLSDSYQVRDLFRPETALEFGAFYLKTQLARYEGQVFPALAAYNAGAGNVDRWQRAWGSDPDLFVELIPFPETNSYVRLVYENYRLYQEIYGE